MIFREPTLQGLFDVCPMTWVPAPDTTAANGQRALTADECAELPNVFGDAGSQPRGHDHVLPISLLLLGTGVRFGEGRPHGGAICPSSTTPQWNARGLSCLLDDREAGQHAAVPAGRP